MREVRDLLGSLVLGDMFVWLGWLTSQSECLAVKSISLPCVGVGVGVCCCLCWLLVLLVLLPSLMLGFPHLLPLECALHFNFVTLRKYK